MEPTAFSIDAPSGEISDAKPRTGFAAWLPGVGLGVALVALVLGALWLQKRPEPVGPIELKRGVETLPNSTMKAYGLRLPRAGRLVVNLASESGEVFSVYLVRLPTDRATARGNELLLVEPFTAERVREFYRSGAVEAGEYHLTVVNATPVNGTHEPSVSMLVRLDN
jgi:hypothetical protein